VWSLNLTKQINAAAFISALPLFLYSFLFLGYQEHAFIKQSNEQSRFYSKRWVTAILQDSELEQHQKS